MLPAYQQVAEQIQDLIVAGTLSVGERLPAEGELAAQFGVSRSTMREALRSLSSQSLLRTKRGMGGGTFVAEPSPDHVQTYLERSIGLLSGAAVLSLDDLREAREVLEVAAAWFAATRRGDDEMRDLEASLASQADIDLGGEFEGHHQFHIILVRAAQNRLIEVLALAVFMAMRDRRGDFEASRSVWETIASDHRDIFAAVVDRDADAAGLLMRGHIARVGAMTASVEQSRAAALRGASS